MSNEKDIDVVEISRMGRGNAISRAEIDSKVATAKEYPRSKPSVYKAELMEMATMDKKIAESCFYSLPRAGKTITGPGIRLAEMAQYCYGNIAVEGKYIVEGDVVKGIGTVWDMEKNIPMRIEVARRITDKNGKRYNADMIMMTGNAAVSIAIRNALFRVIPMAYIVPVYEACMQIAAGDAENFQQAKKKAIEYLGEMGISPERICKSVNRKTVEDITRADLIDLRGFATAIKDGESTIESIFPEVKAEVPEDKLQADEIEQEKQPDNIKKKKVKKAKKAKKTKTTEQVDIFS